MPRHNRRQEPTPAPPGGSRAVERRDTWRGEVYIVRSLTGSGSGKVYRCPGCDQQVTAVTPHIVAWPEHDSEAGDRRHWHTACWSARNNRQPNVARSRSAPRY